MELNNNDAAVCPDSIDAQASTTSAAEIDLYDELIEFAELSPEELLGPGDRPDRPSAEPEGRSADSVKEHSFADPVLTHAPIESETEVEETGSPEAKGAEEHASPQELPDVSAEPVESDTAAKESSEIRVPLVMGPRHSGPLSGLNLPPEIVYTGSLSRGVCLACGAESGADDLFCLTCGVFSDEIASTLQSIPTCGECKQRIEAEEIFCPWCGSTVPASR